MKKLTIFSILIIVFLCGCSNSVKSTVDSNISNFEVENSSVNIIEENAEYDFITSLSEVRQNEHIRLAYFKRSIENISPMTEAKYCGFYITKEQLTITYTLQDFETSYNPKLEFQATYLYENGSYVYQQSQRVLKKPQFAVLEPHVFSVLPYAKDDPIVGTVDSTLGFDIYHAQYGSYFMAKFVGDIETYDGVDYFTIETEDKVIRTINANLVNDGYLYYCWILPREYVRFWFSGCMTNSDKIENIVSLVYEYNQDRMNFIKRSYYWEETLEKLVLKNEEEVLEALLESEYFAGYKPIIAPFGMHALVNPKTKYYAYVNGPKQRNAYGESVENSLAENPIAENELVERPKVENCSVRSHAQTKAPGYKNILEVYLLEISPKESEYQYINPNYPYVVMEQYEVHLTTGEIKKVWTR